MCTRHSFPLPLAPGYQAKLIHNPSYRDTYDMASSASSLLFTCHSSTSLWSKLIADHAFFQTDNYTEKVIKCTWSNGEAFLFVLSLNMNVLSLGWVAAKYRCFSKVKTTIKILWLLSRLVLLFKIWLSRLRGSHSLQELFIIYCTVARFSVVFGINSICGYW